MGTIREQQADAINEALYGVSDKVLQLASEAATGGFPVVTHALHNVVDIIAAAQDELARHMPTPWTS